MAQLALTIHGHFYQPPREDPLTGVIPLEPGSAPFRNWNERIHAECYRPNAAAGNLEKISFNFGPTLLEWMAHFDPDTLNAIVQQDRANVLKHGVGNAMAQAYNHTILPLASYRDKVTQVAWGVADFEHRFGRKPRGLWLPETAVDTETLMVMEDAGIEYTILAPWQANTLNLDPTEPYWISLPGHRRIIAFFYHGDLSGRVSFEPGITVNADVFARNELIKQFSLEKKQRDEPQLLTIATDGELYGHHKPHRERFLQHLTNGATSELAIKTTFPALWLRHNPPRKTIAIHYNTAWSCHHGIARWGTGCPCTPGPSIWKHHLRTAFNQLAAAIDEAYYDYVRRYIVEPWSLRNRYIEVILGQRSARDLIRESAAVTLDEPTIQCLHWMLEAQYERQRMFTSCGWFFEDLNRIEPRNNIAYAAQAVWMVYQASGIDLTHRAIAWLKEATSQGGILRADQVFLQHLQRAQTSHQLMPSR
jgi:alpha-amylase/alpha-mannosidase (GH57 family)